VISMDPSSAPEVPQFFYFLFLVKLCRIQSTTSKMRPAQKVLKLPAKLVEELGGQGICFLSPIIIMESFNNLRRCPVEWSKVTFQSEQSKGDPESRTSA